MSLGLLALCGVGVVAFVLIERDPAIPRGRERFVFAASWPAMIALFAILERTEIARFGFAAMLGAICFATLGRPALIMDLALTPAARRDPSLTSRKVAGYVALVVVGAAAAGWAVWSE